MKILGIRGNMSPDQLRFRNSAARRPGLLPILRFAPVVITFRRSTDVYYVPAGESPVTKGFALDSAQPGGLVGIPWGPIFTVQSLVVNFKGGKDLTADFSAATCRGRTALRRRHSSSEG